MFRKIFMVLLACVLTASMACSCTSTAVSSEDSSSIAASEESVSSAPENITPAYPIVSDKITVKGVIFGTTNDMSHDRLAWEKQEETTNIHVEWEQVDPDMLSVYLASNNWPDFFATPLGSTCLNDYGTIGGKLVDYYDYWDNMPYLQQACKDYPSASKVVTEINGKMYELPYIGNDCTAVTARMYYREDSLNDIGCAVPTTVEEFHDVLTKLKDHNNGAAPLAEAAEDFLWSSFGTGKNIDFEDDGNGNVIYNRVSDQYKLYLQYMNQLYSEGLLHQEYLTIDKATKVSLAQSGLLVFGNGGIAQLVDTDFASGKCEITQLTPLTSEYDNERSVVGWNYCRPSGFAINADSKYITELCRLFDTFYAEDEVVEGSGLCCNLFHYGVEGETWQWSNSEHTEYEVLTPAGQEFWTYMWDQWEYSLAIGRFDIYKDASTSTEGNNKARQQGFINNLIPYQEEVAFPGSYLKFTEDEQSVLDEKYTTISSYITEMEGKFITGVANIDTSWDEYVSTVQSMGLKEVLEVYQSAYDRWNA